MHVMLQSCCNTLQPLQHQHTAQMQMGHTSYAYCDCPRPCAISQVLAQQHEDLVCSHMRKPADICQHANSKVSDVRVIYCIVKLAFRRSVKLSTWLHSSFESLSASILARLLKSSSSLPISYTKLL